jgi:glycerophosphoryl diester phosphodiesterase
VKPLLYLLAGTLGLCLSSATGARELSRPVPGYVRTVPREAETDRARRHARVAERRRGPAVIVHRGASAFAPENTLEAYAAAMDYGADGCEIDLRRTADGVLVLFHDDMLDRLTDGFGTVPQVTYPQLLTLHPRYRYGTAGPDTRPPTFAALLRLAQQRAMLLHLDVKEPRLEDQITALLDEADAWDHVVAVNTPNAPRLSRDSRVHGLRYKAPGLYDGRRDVDPAAVRAALERPGELIMVDDPRVAARELKREAYHPVALPPGLREAYPPAEAPAPPANVLDAPAHLRAFRQRIDADSVAALVRTLTDVPAAERTEVDGDAAYQRRRTEGILERAWAAQRLGELARKTPAVVAALEQQVSHRSLHRDWMFHGLDGAMAARALGMLHATGSAPVLAAAFQRVDPDLQRVVNPEFGPSPLAWTDFRLKLEVLSALGKLPCAASKQCLESYLALDAAQARELAPPAYEEATQALLRQKLSPSEAEALLRSTNGAVRGTAILEYLDRPTHARTEALRSAAPWALALPAARPG